MKIQLLLIGVMAGGSLATPQIEGQSVGGQRGGAQGAEGQNPLGQTRQEPTPQATGPANSGATARVVGRWTGEARLGPTNLPQQLDLDQLIKLRSSQAMLKTIQYELTISADGRFTTLVTGPEMRPRAGKGIWMVKGDRLELNMTEENGAQTRRTLSAKVNPSKQELMMSIPSRPGLPETRIFFRPSAPAGTPPPPGASSPG